MLPLTWQRPIVKRTCILGQAPVGYWHQSYIHSLPSLHGSVLGPSRSCIIVMIAIYGRYITKNMRSEQIHWKKVRQKQRAVKIQVTALHIFHEVNLCVSLTDFPTYGIHSSNISLWNIMKNHWMVKYRSVKWSIISSPLNSLQYIKQNHIRLNDLHKFLRSIFVSHWSIIPRMTFIHQMVSRNQAKFTGPRNAGHSDLHLMTHMSSS